MGNTQPGKCFNDFLDSSVLREKEKEKKQKSKVRKHYHKADWNFDLPRDVHEKFEIGDKKLGEGGFGVTWKGKNKETGEYCAVKQIGKKQMFLRGETPVYLRRELDALMRLSKHPNIADFYGSFEDEDSVFIAMELCTGGELFHRIVARGRYTEKDAAHIIRQMLTVIAECHIAGVVHRDLKPENFLFETPDEDAPLKLIDFGLCGMMEYGKVDALMLSGSVGTLYYMAPEVYEGKHTTWADIWSIGVITYVMLSGCFPFYAQDAKMFHKKSSSEPLNFTHEPWPRISKYAKDFISNCMRKSPTQRVSAAQALSLPWVREDGPAPDVPMDIATIVMMHRFNNVGKMTRLALLGMAKFVNVNVRQDLQDQFDHIDLNKDGVIDFDEWKTAGKSLMQGILPDSKIQGIFHACDLNHDGVIDFEEFVAATIRMDQVQAFLGSSWQTRISQVFKHFDQDHDGFITENDLKHFIVQKNRDLRKYIKEGDLDGDGKIGEEDFAKLIRGADSLSGRLDLQSKSSGDLSMRNGGINSADPSRPRKVGSVLLNEPIALKMKLQSFVGHVGTGVKEIGLGVKDIGLDIKDGITDLVEKVAMPPARRAQAVVA